MEITRKGPILTIGTKSILIGNILYIDHDAWGAYVVLNGKLSQSESNRISIPFVDVTAPQVFASALQLHDYLDSLRNQSGIVNGSKVIVLSDTVDCTPGYLKVKNNGTGGLIKYTTVDGDTDQDFFAAGQVSEFRVKRIWSSVTVVAVANIRILN